MEAFYALLALCAGNPPVTGEFPSQWPVARSFDVFFYLRLNKRLGKVCIYVGLPALSSKSVIYVCETSHQFAVYTNVELFVQVPALLETCYTLWHNKKPRYHSHPYLSLAKNANTWRSNQLHTPSFYLNTVYPKKYAHGFCFAVLCCGYTLTDFLIYIRLTSLALWQSNDCPSASKATLMNMNKYFMWIHYERLHNHNKAKHNKTVCIFLGDILYHVLSVRIISNVKLDLS